MDGQAEDRMRLRELASSCSNCLVAKLAETLKGEEPICVDEKCAGGLALVACNVCSGKTPKEAVAAVRGYCRLNPLVDASDNMPCFLNEMLVSGSARCGMEQEPIFDLHAWHRIPAL